MHTYEERSQKFKLIYIFVNCIWTTVHVWHSNHTISKLKPKKYRSHDFMTKKLRSQVKKVKSSHFQQVKILNSTPE